MEPTKSQITNRDAIIYALGIGYSEDPMNIKHLNFTYENSEDFKVCPTYGNKYIKSDKKQYYLNKFKLNWN